MEGQESKVYAFPVPVYDRYYDAAMAQNDSAPERSRKKGPDVLDGTRYDARLVFTVDFSLL